METRKIQSTGGSSYIITLPKNWIKSTNLKKNDTVGIIYQPDGNLLITAKPREEKQKNKAFKISHSTNPTHLFRELIGAYIAGYNTIEIKSTGRMPPVIRTTARRFTSQTIGEEIIEETDELIKIKDLLDPSEMPFENTIKRMYVLVKTMLEDSMNALRNRDTDTPGYIISRDTEVDRLHWLVARQYNLILQDVTLAGKMKTDARMAATYYLTCRIIERIGDHAVRIAENINTLIENNVDTNMVDKINRASRVALKIFEDSIGGIIRKDIKLSNKTIDSVEKLEKIHEELYGVALHERGELALSLGYIVESIRRIGEYSVDISECAINYIAEKSL